MSRASEILKRLKMSEGSMNSLGQLDKKAIGIVEDLVKNDYGKNNDTQKDMADKMGQLAEMDSPVANHFMGFMNEQAGEYDMDSSPAVNGPKVPYDDETDDESVDDGDGKDKENAADKKKDNESAKNKKK